MADLRMPDLNKVLLAGRLTRDPDLKYVGSGKAVCKLGLAVTRTYKTREGERREDTTFVDVTVWDKLAEYIGQNYKKGRPVMVEGNLRSDSWEDKQTGQKRTKLEVIASSVQALDWEDRGGAGGSAPSRQPGSRAASSSSYEDEPPAEDDIPF